MDESQSARSPATRPDTWVDQYGDYLYRYALSRLRDPESSEEVVQETFLAGLRHAQQFAGRGAERAWLLGILKRKIIDHVRKRNRASALTQGESSADISELLFDESGRWREDPRIGGGQPGAAAESEEFWEILRKCLKGLPTRQADVFTLREIDGLSSREICQDLEISASNLWVLLHRARLRLANCMKSRWH